MKSPSVSSPQVADDAIEAAPGPDGDSTVATARVTVRTKRGSPIPLGPATAAILVGALGVMAVGPARDPDVFWHLKTGQWIWAHHGIPKVDPFSWTAPGRKWIAHEWLTEVAYASLHSAFGWPAIALISALIIVAGWMFVRATCLRLGAQPISATLVTLLAAISSLHTWGSRPQMISLMLTAVFAWLISCASTKSQGSTTNPKRLLITVPIMLLWANLHGGYIFGVAMLWAFSAAIAGEVVLRRTTIGRRLLAGRTAEGPNAALLKPTLFATIASTAVTFVNPNGVDGFLYPFSYLGKNASTKYVAEWFAPDFSKVQYWPFAILAALFAVAILKRRRTSPLYFLAIGVPFAFLAFQSVRNITQFSILAAPLICTLKTRSNDGKRSPQQNDKKASRIVFAITGIALLVATLPTLTVSANREAQARTFPAAAAKQLISMANVKIFNQYDWGGYLLHAVPGLKVYVDGRPDMYGDAFVDHFISIWWLKPGWKQRLTSDGVNTVIANPQANLITELQRDKLWQQVYADNVAVILRRR